VNAADVPAFGTQLPRIVAEPPGPRSRAVWAQGREFESRNLTYGGDGGPIVIQRAFGANVTDVDGNVYVDLSGFFGVASVGHANPDVLSAMAGQAQRLFHGLGDIYPSEPRLQLARELCRLMPGPGPKRAILTGSGSEAVEVALKTAKLATGKPGVICFRGAYHGLGYGALEVTDGELFRSPFSDQLGGFGRRAGYPYCYRCPLALRYPECGVACLASVVDIVDREGDRIGAVLVEPILGRGGDVPAPAGWLAALRRLCDARGLLLIFDEIFTGFGRTGRWFACEHAGVAPDLLCVGKGLTAGFPIAACIGRADVMDAWPASTGEAIHTATFMGHPAGCAAALACLRVLRERGLVERAAALAPRVRERLEGIQAANPTRIGDVRGAGLLWGLEFITEDGRPEGRAAAAAARAALRRGVLLLRSGPQSAVLSLSPPLVISEEQLWHALAVVSDAASSA
jgi:4-aminobutyrate aminotransferase/(S)-3-amino-2-methylpropionate transaminase